MLVFLPLYRSQSLTSLPHSLLPAQGIWSCHSDNELHPTWKQTKQKAFVYWWQVPRCFTSSLCSWQIESVMYMWQESILCLTSLQSLTQCLGTLWRDWESFFIKQKRFRESKNISNTSKTKCWKSNFQNEWLPIFGDCLFSKVKGYIWRRQAYFR